MMAERRMFAKAIIDSDAFLDMPITARLLYYDLAMRADDDGFVNSPKKILRMIGCSVDDMKILVAKKFVIPFESGVVVIKHWRIHNYIRKDTYNETTYKDEKKQLVLDENNAYTVNPDKREVLPDTTDNSLWTDRRRIVDGSSTGRGRVVDGSSTQVRLGKVSIDKINICGAEAPQKEKTTGNVTSNVTVTESNATDKEKPKRNIIPPKLEWIQEYCRERGNSVDPEKFFDFYESKGWMVGKNKMKDWQSSVRTWERNSPNQKKQDEDDDLRRFEFV